MPRDGSGIFTKPFPDTISGTTVESAVHNGTVADFTTDANAPRPIVAGGTGANNVTQARDNLEVEVAGKLVTNFDIHVWENGSFYTQPNVTGGPVADHAYIGTCQIHGDPQHIVLQMRDLMDTVVPGTLWIKQKISGFWGEWISTGSVRTGTDGFAGIISPLADMFFGAVGTSPNSSFVVNSESDVSGVHLLQINKTGTSSLKTPLLLETIGAAPATLNLKSGTGQTDLFWSQPSGNSWLMRNEVTSGDFNLYRYNQSTGALIDVSLSIAKASGAVTITGNTTLSTVLVNNNATITGTLGVVSNAAVSGTFGVGGAATFNGAVTFTGPLVLAAGGRFIAQAPSGGISDFLLHNDAATFIGRLWWDRTDNSINVQHGTGNDNIKINAVGSVNLAKGLIGRQGTAGAVINGDVHNFFWDSSLIQCWINSTFVGQITFVSDYRIKKDVVDLPSQWETVKALRPIKYTQAQYTPQIEAERLVKTAAAGEDVKPMFAADDIERWGFIAHELQETLTPSAATGVKDAPDAVQSPNPWTVIAALTSALQEAMARIEALEAA